MNSMPQIRLEFFGTEAMTQALSDTAAPHLPRNQIADHYALGNDALRRALDDKISHLVKALEPQLRPAQAPWSGARADVLALDLAFVEHAQQPFDLAWVEIQAFTSMLPSFHTVHQAQRRLHDPGTHWLPYDALPRGTGWVDHMRQWVAPHAATVLIEDRPRDRMSWPDLDAARHWWQVDVHDWRELVPANGHLWNPVTSGRYTHVWNRLIFSDLPMFERNHAKATLLAANKLSWHSHPAWYDGINKGSLADLPLPPHEACHWVENSPTRASAWTDAERWVAKSVSGHSGNGLLLNPSPAELAALPGPRQWIVQNKFRQVPIGQHPLTGQALFGEIRCMLGLQPGRKPWVMAWILRCSTNGIATMSGRQSAPGEGMTLLYFNNENARH